MNCVGYCNIIVFVSNNDDQLKAEDMLANAADDFQILSGIESDHEDLTANECLTNLNDSMNNSKN